MGTVQGKATVSPSWRLTETGTTSLLFAVDVVDSNTVWAAGGVGTPGVVVRTTDGGQSWRDVTPPGGDTLDFHDVEAFDRDHAVVLAVGLGDPSRIYHTDDGGSSWRLAFQNTEADAFYDSMAFFDQRHGLALSDPVGGFFRLVTTEDGGRTWRIATTKGMPPAITNDGGEPPEFAHATGTSLVTAGPRDAWFGTDLLAGSSRVFHTRDRGRTWTVTTSPIPGEPEFGIASFSFRDHRHGLALGGGVLETDVPSVVAVTTDGGETWSREGSLSGFRIGIARVPTNTNEAAVAVGPTGSEISTDGGRHWALFDETDLRSINCRPHVPCWAVGKDGMAAELTLTKG